MTTPVWDDLLTEEERHALDPGAPDGGLDPTPDVLVVGGGAIGLATAVFLRRAGMERVTLIERGRLANGPTGRAAGTLTPGIHALIRPDPFVRLAMRGLELHRQLDEEWDNAAGFRSIDSLVAPPVVPPAEFVERSGAKLLEGVEAREVEPEFGEVECAIHFLDQGAVPPLRFAAELAARAGQVATGVELLDLETSGDRVVRVRTSHGDLSPGAVVLATGSSERIPTPQRQMKGHMLATEPATFRLNTMPAGIVGLVQTEEGRIVVGGSLDLGDEDPEIRPEVIEALVGELHRLVPRAKELRTTHRWTCFRPATTDEVPVIDLLPDLTNAWVSVGHFRTGIMVAPAAAELVAEWIASGTRPAAAGDFAVARP